MNPTRETIRLRILESISKHPRYPHDLYQSFAQGHLSHTDFKHLIKELRSNNAILINANGLILLPPSSSTTHAIPTLHPLEYTSTVENHTQAIDMDVDEILTECKRRVKTPRGDCTYQVEHDAHMDNLSRGIYRVYHSGNQSVRTSDFESAGFSIMPTKSNGEPAVKYRQYWKHRRKAKDWGHKAWRNAYGIQIFTGAASQKTIEGTVYYPICWDIEADLLREHPEIFQKTVEWAIAIRGISIIISKSGGIRINAWVPFIRRKKHQMVARREWRDENNPEKIRGVTYAEILSGQGLARIDERYLLVKGRIDEWAVLTQDVFMKPMEWLEPLDARIRRQTNPNETIPNLDENLPDNLTWKQGDKFLISTERYDCEYDHKSNPTCEYRRDGSGRITKWCWACNTGWIVPECKSDNANFTTSIESTPRVEVQEKPSYPHWTPEERIIVQEILNISPDAGWHGQTPVFTTKYEHLCKFTNNFVLNSQTSGIEKHRVWITLLDTSQLCCAPTARWIDRYLLTAGYYCDGCQKDYQLGSYLQWELARKPTNSIVSDYQGVLGEDPEFRDFCLWEPQTLTHLGSGMSTGKSTEISNQIRNLAIQGIGRGVIGVPSVSSARFLAYHLRSRDGHAAWGLWHQGCEPLDRFIGNYGAIVCLPSLPYVIELAKTRDLRCLYIAVDELDFAYNLLWLSQEQSYAVKKCLQEAYDSIGLVVSGKTVSTLVLEAFAEEIGCENENLKAFYSRAKPSDGSVTLHKYADVKGKSNAVLMGSSDNILDVLSAGYNAYVFCQSRRDANVLADMFSDENPVVCTAYTKGTLRVGNFLRNQRLTDSRLFIGTSVAGVGISIKDEVARTIIVANLNNNRRNTDRLVHMAGCDSRRNGGNIHYTDYQLKLPIKPTEHENINLYHEQLKYQLNNNSHLSEAILKKRTRAEALPFFADREFEDYITHYLGNMGNMQVNPSSALMPAPERIESIAQRRREIRRNERSQKLKHAITILENREILTKSEVRKLGTQNKILPELLPAHETANGIACAVGWDDRIDRDKNSSFEGILSNDDITVAVSLAERNISVEKLEKQRRGYLAVHFPKFVKHEFEINFAKTEPKFANTKRELGLTTINNDQFLGELLKALLDRLESEVLDTKSLASVVREVLIEDRFLDEIKKGALGLSEYQSTRFLRGADDQGFVKWVQDFISDWYPARISKKGENFGLVHAKDYDLRLTAFQRWLVHQSHGYENDNFDMPMFQPTELPDQNIELKAIARERREAGVSLSEIANELGVDISTVSRWCSDISKKIKADQIAEAIRLEALGMKRKDIAAELNIHPATLRRRLSNP